MTDKEQTILEERMENFIAAESKRWVNYGTGQIENVEISPVGLLMKEVLAAFRVFNKDAEYVREDPAMTDKEQTMLELADKLDANAIRYANDYGYGVATDLKKAAAVLRTTVLRTTATEKVAKYWEDMYTDLLKRTAAGEITDDMVNRAAREIWNDRDGRMGGTWESRDQREVCVIQTKATARAALVSALINPDNEVVNPNACCVCGASEPAMHLNETTKKLYCAQHMHLHLSVPMVPKSLLDERDDFIVNKGLWSEFMETLR